MPKNLKFHAIAIFSICAIILVVYSLMGPTQQANAPSTAANDGTSLRIYSATWGENCTPYINEALKARMMRTPAQVKEDTANNIPVPTIATKNNVLEIVGSSCNGQHSCVITPNSAKLGVEPMASCTKQLVIGYRCYSFSPLITAKTDQEKTLTIDCTKNEATTPAAK